MPQGQIQALVQLSHHPVSSGTKCLRQNALLLKTRSSHISGSCRQLGSVKIHWYSLQKVDLNYLDPSTLMAFLCQ